MNISRNMLLAALVTFGFNVVASETPVTPPATTSSEAGIVSKITGFIYAGLHLPFDLLDSVAGYTAPGKLAEWQGSNVATTDKDGKTVEPSFVAAHNLYNRVWAITELAAVAAAGKYVYDNFIAEDDSADEEYVDVFEEPVA